MSFAQKKGTIFLVRIYRHERKVIIKHLLSDIQEHVLKEAEHPQFVPDPSSLISELGSLGRWVSVTNPALDPGTAIPAEHNPSSPVCQGQSYREILKALQSWERGEPAIPQTKCPPSLKAME